MYECAGGRTRGEIYAKLGVTSGDDVIYGTLARKSTQFSTPRIFAGRHAREMHRVLLNSNKNIQIFSALNFARANLSPRCYARRFGSIDLTRNVESIKSETEILLFTRVFPTIGWQLRTQIVALSRGRLIRSTICAEKNVRLRGIRYARSIRRGAGCTLYPLKYDASRNLFRPAKSRKCTNLCFPLLDSGVGNIRAAR